MDFFLLVELQRDGSAPAACTADLFIENYTICKYQGLSKHQEVGSTRDESDQIDLEFLGPSWCKKTVDPER